MDHTGIISILNKGASIPDKVLDDVLLKHGGFLSIALAEQNEAGEPVVSAMRLNLKDDHPHGSKGIVKDALEALKDFRLLLHFTEDETNNQPFVLLKNGKGAAELVVCLDGNFEDDVEVEGNQSVEDCFAHEYLGTKVLELYENKADGKIDKLVGHLNNANIQMELGKAGKGEHMAMVMLANTGQMPVFTRKKSPMVKYDWGFNSYDLEAKPAAETMPAATVDQPATHHKPQSALDRVKAGSQGQGPVKAAPPKELSMADRLKAAREAKAAEAGKTDVTDAKVVHQPVSGNTVAAAQPADDPLLLVPIPSRFDSLANRRKWFRRRTPETHGLPENWETINDALLVPLSIMRSITNKKDEKIKEQFPLAKSGDIKEALRIAKTATAIPADAGKPSVPTAGKSQATPAEEHPLIIPKKHLENLNHRFFSKARTIALIDKKGDNVQDPALSVLIEDVVPPFWEQIEQLPNMESTYHFTGTDFNLIGENSLTTLSKMALDYKNGHIKKDRLLLRKDEIIDRLTKQLKEKGVVVNEDKTQVSNKTLPMAERLAASRKNPNKAATA